MPTISIRVTDDLKARLDSLAQESESTMSSVITEALNSITGIGRTDYPEETAPYTINNTNRLILRNQEVLLSLADDLDDDEREQHRKNAIILEFGFTGEYPGVFASLRPEIPYSRTVELFDILDMFRVLRGSYERLSDEEKESVDERDISFRGFDYSSTEETALPGYVEYLFSDNRYKELEEPLMRFSDGGNSHIPIIDVYRRMLRCFKEVWRPHLLAATSLKLEEIKKVVAASSYNSGY
ncbi:YfbU family protein [uncultured Olegusella sp.]|uniref:YfbU family protein n=1 Tax=uncultured Olegusella sp. TaxID=1979846 RepID=UPI002624771F|nr:YfbU family protein [uncultured Olegusella sp.]